MTPWLTWFSRVGRAVLTPLGGQLRTPLGGLVTSALASALCGLFLHPQGFVVLLLVSAVTALGLIWPWLCVVGLSGSLEFDRARGREGERVRARLRVRNRAPWGAWGVAVRGGFPRAERPLAGLAHVPGWRTTAAEFDFVPPCRGVYPTSPLRLVCGFPFGLTRASRTLTVSTRLLVWPATCPVGPPPDLGQGSTGDGPVPRDRAGNWGDPLGVRPYRRGDALRRVHWGQTARHGRLIVCEVQSHAVPRVQVILDTFPASHGGDGPDGSLEWAVRVAASLAEGWVRNGADVEVVTGGGPVHPRARGASGRRALLDAMARLSPAAEVDLASLLGRPECRTLDAGARVVVTTDRALRSPRAAGACRREDRFVVLSVGGFGAFDEPGSTAALAAIPWVRIEAPAQVAARLRRWGEGVGVG